MKAESSDGKKGSNLILAAIKVAGNFVCVCVKVSKATTHRRVKEFGYSCRIPLVN